LPSQIIVQPFSWRWYTRTASACKLWDYDAGCWTGFDGRPLRPATAH
jgi:acyl-lipid omega-6 desaturase (Delta-12 desaturase)